MMIKVEAIVREEKFEDVKAALNEIEVNGITVSGSSRMRSTPWLRSKISCPMVSSPV